MRSVQEMTVEFVNALNAAAAAESECAKLRRMLEEEQTLVQRLKQEREDEVQMANRKIERMSQRLAEARKDVEYASVRADVAENEWIKVKRELQEAQELVQFLKLENEKTRQRMLKQVEEKQLELANALDAAAMSESKYDTLRTMLEEERDLVQRIKLEKDEEAQLIKRQIEEISQELADAKKNAEYATTRADLAENEWIKTKRELKKERELLQMLKPDCDETRQSAVREVEEKELELANNISNLEIAENEWVKVKKELQENLEHVQLLKQEYQETRQNAMKQVEEKGLEFTDALSALDAAATAASSSTATESECAKLKRMILEEGKTVQRLILEKDFVAQLAKRRIEETRQELANIINACATTESNSTAEGSATTSAFATLTQSQSTPFGSSASSTSFGSSGNTVFSSTSSSPIFRSSTASSVSTVGSSMFRSSAASATSTASSPMFGSSPTSAASPASLPMFGSTTTSVSSSASSPMFQSSASSIAPSVGSPMFGSSTTYVNSPMFGSFSTSTASSTKSPMFGSSNASSSAIFGSSRASATSTVNSFMFGSFPSASSTSSSFLFRSSNTSSSAMFGSIPPSAASTANSSFISFPTSAASTTSSSSLGSPHASGRKFVKVSKNRLRNR